MVRAHARHRYEKQRRPKDLPGARLRPGDTFEPARHEPDRRPQDTHVEDHGKRMIDPRDALRRDHGEREDLRERNAREPMDPAELAAELEEAAEDLEGRSLRCERCEAALDDQRQRNDDCGRDESAGRQDLGRRQVLPRMAPGDR
jgi:hypothetical protein